MTAPPTPLTSVDVPPSFPIEVLPVPVAEEVAAVATFTQTDPTMAATAGLSVLAACAGGRCELEVRPGWREPLNLFTATVAEPGERKSAVMATMVAPLLEAERALVEASRETILEAEITRDIARKAAEKAKTVAGNTDDEEDRRSSALSAISAALAAESIEVPVVPRIVADDVTPEAAGSLLAEQHGRLAILSAEGGVFDVLAGRYSGNVNLDTFLKGHAGDTLKVDRKGRAPEYIPRPALTVGLMIQPQVLTAIAKNGAFRGRGLLARFLFTIPTSYVGNRRVDAPVVPTTVQDLYNDTVSKLARTLAEWKDPAIIQLDDRALAVLLDFARVVEPQLRATARLGHVRDWGSKLVGATARIAGLLHLGDNPATGWRAVVTAGTVERAVTVAEVLIHHALGAFDAMQADPVTADAVYLLDVIEREGWTVVSRRDLFSGASRSRFPTVADVDPVIQKLEDHGYLLPLPQPERGKGRPPSPKWQLNPHVAIAQAAEIAEVVGQ